MFAECLLQNPITAFPTLHYLEYIFFDFEMMVDIIT